MSYPAGQDDLVHLRAYDQEYEYPGLGTVRRGNQRGVPHLREEVRERSAGLHLEHVPRTRALLTGPRRTAETEPSNCRCGQSAFLRAQIHLVACRHLQFAERRQRH